MNLYFLRHGEAGSRSSNAMRDTERALTEKGFKEVEKIATAMTILGIELDIIATSPLKRAKQTAIIVDKKIKNKHELQVWDELKPLSAIIDVYKKISSLKDSSSIMMVGHEPNLSSMIGEIITKGSTPRVALKKGGLAKIFILSLSEMKGEMRWLLTPKQLRLIAD